MDIETRVVFTRVLAIQRDIVAMMNKSFCASIPPGVGVTLAGAGELLDEIAVVRDHVVQNAVGNLPGRR